MLESEYGSVEAQVLQDGMGNYLNKASMRGANFSSMKKIVC